MEGFTMEVKGGKLLIEVDLKHDGGPSKTGKTAIIATSRGAASAPGSPDVKVNLNVYRQLSGR